MTIPSFLTTPSFAFPPNGASSGSVVMGELNTGELAFLVVGYEQNTQQTISSVSSTHLTWDFFHLFEGGGAGHVTHEIWTAVNAGSNLFNETINVVFSAAIDNAVIVVSRTTGQSAAIFDSNSSTPSDFRETGGVNYSGTISTNESNCMVLAVSTNSEPSGFMPTTPSGWTNWWIGTNTIGILFNYCSVQIDYKQLPGRARISYTGVAGTSDSTNQGILTLLAITSTPNGVSSNLMPLVYPQNLQGISIEVDWEPQFFNTQPQVTASGAKIILGLADTPLHTFTLKYNFLRDFAWKNGATEWKTMSGFFLALQANLGRFLFKWADDNQVFSQNIGTTDGVTTTWTLVRTFGSGENSGTEPIGWLDQTMMFRVYLDGTLQDPSTYTLSTTVGALQQIVFNTAPANGHVITVDMSYFYYCMFSDPKMTFSKFMNQLWSVNKVQIESCRPHA